MKDVDTYILLITRSYYIDVHIANCTTKIPELCNLRVYSLAYITINPDMHQPVASVCLAS